MIRENEGYTRISGVPRGCPKAGKGRRRKEEGRKKGIKEKKRGKQAKKQQLEMLNKKLQRWNWKEVDRLSHGTVRGRWQRLPMLMMQIL